MPCRWDRLVLATTLSQPLAERSSMDFIDTLGYDFIGLPEASAIHNVLKRAAEDLQRELRWRVQVSNFETACRMIEANSALVCFRRIPSLAMRAQWRCGSSGSMMNGPNASCKSACPQPIV
ncbi:transcriptional regulator LysR family (plasmid) [Cupriavidus necator N-1]|uniref:Transcriptional regulator LysR family n=1 Tax=Cupriavidus necator (strain ATCC 43291 / DSM 13513 / CCUG 52238 / LMG 8453 / N-1) TaxID=1042878 RepID=F8GUK5_CUPNN